MLSGRRRSPPPLPTTSATLVFSLGAPLIYSDKWGAGVWSSTLTRRSKREASDNVFPVHVLSQFHPLRRIVSHHCYSAKVSTISFSAGIIRLMIKAWRDAYRRECVGCIEVPVRRLWMATEWWNIARRWHEGSERQGGNEFMRILHGTDCALVRLVRLIKINQ